MTIINKTPHPINLLGTIIPPSLPPARLEETVEQVGTETLENGTRVPIIRKVTGAIVNLPAPSEGVVLVVSLPVAQAAARPDVLAIGVSIRDDSGNIVGAKSLATFCN